MRGHMTCYTVPTSLKALVQTYASVRFAIWDSICYFEHLQICLIDSDVES